MANPEAERPAFSKWFADVAATPGLSPADLAVAMRVGAIGMGENSPGLRLYFESTRKLAAMAGLDRRTVQKALGRLVNAGLLRVHRKGGGRGRSTEYQILRNFAEDLAIADYHENGGAEAAVSGRKGGAPAAHSEAEGRPSLTAVSPERAVDGAERAVAQDQKGRPSSTAPILKNLYLNGPAPPLEAADADPDPNPLTPEAEGERRRMLRVQAARIRREAEGSR